MTQIEIIQMVDLMIGAVELQMKNKDMTRPPPTKAKVAAGQRGFDPVLGARPLRRPSSARDRGTSCRKISSAN